VSYAGVLALCLGGARLACSTDALRNSADAVNQLRQESRRGSDLERDLTAGRHRRHVQRQAVEELIAGRATLSETMDLFWCVSRGGWQPGSDRPETTASECDDEAIYRHILVFVEEILRDRPEEAPAILRRLRREYQTLCSSPESLPLPPVAPVTRPSLAPMPR
jgi:hypothetical protein